jgi:hypothetical protein
VSLNFKHTNLQELLNDEKRFAKAVKVQTGRSRLMSLRDTLIYFRLRIHENFFCEI